MAESAPWMFNAHSVLLELMAEFARFGATDNGGVSRLAGSADDGKVRDYLCDWLTRHDYAVKVDAVGNLFGCLDLNSGDPAQYFFSGSHLDTQPVGGRYDGALGVACACVAGLVLRDAVQSGAVSTHYRYYMAVCWTGEEGARFQPSLLGSSAFAGALSVETALASKDSSGQTLFDALCTIGYHGTDVIPSPACYLELHIEQGTQLEAEQCAVGVVSACWGAKKLTVECVGQPDHTGPTPMAARKDALLAASQIIVTVHGLTERDGCSLHSSVARIEVSPNSPNTVADHVSVWIELRSPEAHCLTTSHQALQKELDRIAVNTQCTLSIIDETDRGVIQFDRTSQDIVKSRLDENGIGNLSMTTIAGHDAIQLQSLCPSTLLFVPSKDGISHSPDEFTSDEDICTGFDAMLHAASALMAQPASTVGQAT